ncbi:PorT family protein [Mucilaginibacter sp. X4EP1]|uniref:PorT family protein n=1 Tax=Mucilaginibacter sp. X4EP1 TaxID=2723092 RepID=UPI0021699A74|nr:PorT family protein [Mucilaginibacter sp. X4EP1]
MIICLTAHCLPAHSQAVLALLFGNKVSNPNLSLGIHVGLEMSNLTNTPGANVLPGLALGAYTNIKFSSKWSLSNYFIFKSPRGAASVPLAYQIQPNVPDAEAANLRRKLTYLEISPLPRYNFTPELSLAAGPQFAIKVVSKDIYKSTLTDGGQETLVYNLKDNYNWLDVDAAADLQYAFYKGNGVRLNLRFSQGLTNIYNDKVPFNAKNQYFQIGVGIPISTGASK